MGILDKKEKKITCKHCGLKQIYAKYWEYQQCQNCKRYLYDNR